MASDDEIAAHARANLAQMSIISGDRDFADIIRYPPSDYSGIVVIEPPRRATRTIVLMLVEQFLNVPDVVRCPKGSSSCLVGEFVSDHPSSA